MNDAINNRYEFAVLFDVKDGNPNGDPDSGNLPRLDSETGAGLVTHGCLKRKIRNYVQLSQTDRRFNIFIQERIPLNPKIAEACRECGKDPYQKKNGGWDTTKSKGRSQAEIKEIQAWLCANYYDIRTFGAVMSTGPNSGQIRGPVQICDSRSIDRINLLEHTITRVTDVDKEEGEIGRRATVPYGLYRVHGYISAPFAQKTGFSEEDLDLFWSALENMFEHDRSAARGEMAVQKLFVFRHDNPLGNAPAHRLFKLIQMKRKDKDRPPRDFDDYEILVDRDNLPNGVQLIERL